MRLFATGSNGKKFGKSAGTVNNNGSKAKKFAHDERPQTIYPFPINELKELQPKPKTIIKKEKPTVTVSTDRFDDRDQTQSNENAVNERKIQNGSAIKPEAIVVHF